MSCSQVQMTSPSLFPSPDPYRRRRCAKLYNNICAHTCQILIQFHSSMTHSLSGRGIASWWQSWARSCKVQESRAQSLRRFNWKCHESGALWNFFSQNNCCGHSLLCFGIETKNEATMKRSTIRMNRDGSEMHQSLVSPSTNHFMKH